MQIGIKGIPIIHALLQCGMALLGLGCFALCSSNAVLRGGELFLQPHRSLLRLLHSHLHVLQFLLQVTYGGVEAGYLDVVALRASAMACAACAAACSAVACDFVAATCNSASMHAYAIC